MKRALITGITGQDGSYLAELLLEKGYEVHGLRRRTSLFNTDRIDHLYKDRHESGAKLFLHFGDMTDTSSIIRVMQQVDPHELYNLAAQSHVHVSFEEPEYTANSDALGTLRLLEAMRSLGISDTCRFYNASTSELFGKVQEIPQVETTPFYPRSPYACAKLYAHWITVNFRESYNMFASNGILFNHESPVRGETFVTRKITRALAAICAGQQRILRIGNLDAKRDWGHARDYVKAMWLILQQKVPKDYVIATGNTTSVREFIKLAFAEVGVSLLFQGNGIEEVGSIETVDNEIFQLHFGPAIEPPSVGAEVVLVDPEYFRPAEVDLLVGDAGRAREELGWAPTVDLQMLIREMVEADIYLAKQKVLLNKAGFEKPEGFQN